LRGTFQGSLTALPTPFRGGELDFRRFADLIERQIAAGTDGLVVAGTTGEAATLSPTERRSLFTYAVGVTRRRVPLLAGVGTNATRSTLELALCARDAGADGCLVVTPYYNRPSQAGLAHHFETVARHARLPVVLYNVPSRTSVALAPETTLALAERLPNVVAIKEATTPERVAELALHDTIDVLCGDDAWIADGMHAGARGVIGVVANLLPESVAALVRACRAGDEQRAAARVEEQAPLVRALFLESNPAPLKHALALLGLAEEELRSPLVPVAVETGRRIEEALMQARLLL